MAIITQVQVVKNKLPYVLGGSCIWCVWPVLHGYIENTMIISGIFFMTLMLFCNMVNEDWHYETVDLRKFCGLLIGMCIASNQSFMDFGCSFISGMMFFSWLYMMGTMASNHYVQESNLNQNQFDKSFENRPSIGFLFPWAVSTVLWAFSILCFGNPPGFLNDFWECVKVLNSFFDFQFLGIVIWSISVVIFILWKRKMMEISQDIIEGFGVGDILVLSVFTAFLGWNVVLVIFFISLWIQLIFYGLAKIIVFQNKQSE